MPVACSADFHPMIFRGMNPVKRSLLLVCVFTLGCGTPPTTTHVAALTDSRATAPAETNATGPNATGTNVTGTNVTGTNAAGSNAKGPNATEAGGATTAAAASDVETLATDAQVEPAATASPQDKPVAYNVRKP
ncbi:MAG: hypothetical protein ACR2NM_17960, partial [Bythopirellula sp.]